MKSKIEIKWEKTERKKNEKERGGNKKGDWS